MNFDVFEKKAKELESQERELDEQITGCSGNRCDERRKRNRQETVG